MGRSRLGLIPQSQRDEQRVRAFVAALEAVLEIGIDLHRAADYRALVSALEQGLVQFAWLPPLSAARAVRSGSIEPAAIAVRHGATTYYAGLIALEGSGIRTIADLKGLRAAWIDRESASGYVVIRAALRQAGVSLVDAFVEDIFVRSHAEVALALERGLADVGATCFNMAAGSIRLARVSHEAPWGQALEHVHLVAQAGPIPADIFAVHREVPPPALAKLQTGLIGARPASLFEAAKDMMFADGFAHPEPEHVRMLETLYDMISVDPARSVPPPRPPGRP